jgi:hypothetical protein
MATGQFVARAHHGRRDDSLKARDRTRSYGRLKLALTLCLAPVLATGCGSTTPAASSAEPSPAAAAATAAASAQTSPSAAASGQASPSASAGSSVFASRLYGYSLVVPPGWQTFPAGSAWDGVGLEDRCPSDWDCFSGSSGDPTLAVAAASVPADMTLGQWGSPTRFGPPGGCIDSAPTTATTLGGAACQDLDDDLRGRGPPRHQGRRAARGAGILRPVRVADQHWSQDRPRHVELDPEHLSIRAILIRSSSGLWFPIISA